MFCTSCGADVSGLNYCGKCGAKVKIELPATPDLDLVLVGNQLTIGPVYACIKILPHNEQTVRVLVAGDEEAKSGIQFTTRDGSPFLSEKIPGVTFRRYNEVEFYDDGSVTINGVFLPLQKRLDITIYLPTNAALAIEDLCLAKLIEMGDFSNFTLSMSGATDVTAGNFNFLSARMSGSGNLKLGESRSSMSVSIAGSGDVKGAKVNGDFLEIQIAGSGDVKIRGGSVNRVSVSIAGSGDVSLSMSARSSSFSIMGSGDISLDHSDTKPVKSIMGSGDIEVGNW